MGEVVDVPLLLAVHVSGLAVTAGIAGFALSRRRAAGPAWSGLVLGGLLLALTHVFEGALLAPDTTWPLYVRAAGYAAFAVGAAGRVFGATAAVALPVGVNVVAGVAGLLAAVATRGGALGRGRQVTGLTIGLLAWAASDLVATRWVTAALVASLLGSLSAGAWLVSRLRHSLAARLSVVFGAVLLAVVILLASVSAFAFTTDLRADRLDSLQQLASSRVTAVSTQIPGELAGTARLVASASTVAARLDTSTNLDDQAVELVGLAPDADIGLFVDAGGTAIGSYDRRNGAPLGPRETTLAGSEPVRLALERQQSSQGLLRLGVDTTTGAAELFAVAVEPVYQQASGQARRDLLVGAVFVAKRVTSDQSLQDIASQVGADVAIVVGGDLANSTLTLEGPAAATLVAAAAREAEVVDLAGRANFVIPVALSDLSGVPVGALVLVEDASTVADLEALITRALFLAAAIGGLLAALLASVVTSRTTRPLEDLTDAAEQIEAGVLDVQVETGGTDEVGRLASAFNAMAGSLRRREEDLIEAADTQRRLRTRLEAITESMNEALVAVDPDGLVITVNSTAADYFGRPVDELVGADVADLLDGVDAQGDPLFEALGGPADPHSVALRGRLFVRDGAAIDVAATAAPLIDDRGRVYVLRDITGEAQVERMKTEFISNISHELRTPLTPVKAYAALLASRPDMPKDKLEVVAEQLQTSSGQLERIIDMLVTFAALEAGRVELESTRVDLRSEVDAVLDRWRAQYPARTFRRRFRKDTPDVDTDPRLLGQVLDELIDNARKFSEGPIDVHAERADGDRVRLKVKDRGSGIPEEDLAHVSRGFHQVDGSTTRHYGGLGLGLAIVERTLVLLDGHLEIESEVGQGTHVCVLLPVAH